MKRTIFRVLIFSFAFGCVIAAVSPFVFVRETEDVHSQLITYERGLPLPYVIETAQVRRGRLMTEDTSYTRTMGYEILAIPLLSSVLSNTVAVAGVIGIILIRAKQSSLKSEARANRKSVSGIMLTILLIVMLTWAFNIQPVEASATIHIRADGSVDPDTAPISTVDNITYTFTDNIYGEIRVDRDNIVVNGMGYIVDTTDIHPPGLTISSSNNVTVKNLTFTNDEKTAFVICSSSNIRITENNIVGNGDGIHLTNCSNCIITKNNITDNRIGIGLWWSSDNNSLTENNIVDNYEYGIRLLNSANNDIFVNNFINNTQQVDSNSFNIWDDGYPSGGNYWDDYEGEDADGDGVGDTPYRVNKNNQDNYPLITPYVSHSQLLLEIKDLQTENENLLYILEGLREDAMFYRILAGSLSLIIGGLIAVITSIATRSRKEIQHS